MTRNIDIVRETWPLKEPFVIARGSKTETTVVTVSIREGDHTGIGEGVPTARYGESVDSVVSQIEDVRAALADGLTRRALLKQLPAGAARNAVDAALWDLEAKQQAKNVGELSGLGWPDGLVTAQTVSIGTAPEMGRTAAKLKQYPVIKIKLDQSEILARVSAVRENAPDATLLVDANESWSFDVLSSVAPELGDLGVAMIEQPLPAGSDEALSDYVSPVPLYADESCHTRDDLKDLVGKYAAVNIKLDKTGGLTEAIALREAAESMGFDVMLGCMVSTSLGIAPAMLLAQHAGYVDLDAPSLLSSDRTPAIDIRNGRIETLPAGLWGGSRPAT